MSTVSGADQSHAASDNQVGYAVSDNYAASEHKYAASEHQYPPSVNRYASSEAGSISGNNYDDTFRYRTVSLKLLKCMVLI